MFSASNPQEMTRVPNRSRRLTVIKQSTAEIEEQIRLQKSTDADWVLKATVAMAAADDRLDAREVGFIRKVYEEQTGRSVDVSGIVLAVQTYATKRDVFGELSVAAGSMNQQTKEAIVRAAYLTALANERFSAEESEKLKMIANALQISENYLEAILDSTGRKAIEDQS